MLKIIFYIYVQLRISSPLQMLYNAWAPHECECQHLQEPGVIKVRIIFNQNLKKKT